jgi:hypothetical protein
MIKKNQSRTLGILVFVSAALVLFFNNCGKFPEAATQESQTSMGSNQPDPNDVGGSFSGQINSSIQIVSNLGAVWGYASDPINSGKTLRVIFYIDGPVGTGKYAGESQANQTALGANSGHYFSFQIPPEFANGANHTLYAYGYEAKAQYLLKPGAFSYLAFTKKAEAIFNQQIKPFVQNSCSRCHSWNYSALFSGPLLNPNPLNGGSPTNNLFIRKMSGLTGHGGGQFCTGGVNDGICVEIQKWWNAEFK